MDIKSLVDTFFETDNLKELLEQAGRMLDCPLLVVDDAFRIAASYWPNSFQDEVFFGALRRGEITYEAILAISQSEQIAQGQSVRMEVQDTPYPRCFAPLISSNIHIGYLIYVDWKNELHQTPDEQLHMLQMILAKQLLSESSRNHILSSTSEEILVRLLQGEFPSESIFQLQITSSYLAHYKPHRLAVVDLGLYRNLHFGQDTLKNELRYIFYACHPFFYQKQLLFFLTAEHDSTLLFSFSQKFQLRISISGPLDSLYHLPQAYQTAQKLKLQLIHQTEDEAAAIHFMEANVDNPDIQKHLIVDYMPDHIGRNHYQMACKYIRRMAKLGYKPMALELIEQLRTRYRNRRALLEELTGIF